MARTGLIQACLAATVAVAFLVAPGDSAGSALNAATEAPQQLLLPSRVPERLYAALNRRNAEAMRQAMRRKMKELRGGGASATPTPTPRTVNCTLWVGGLGGNGTFDSIQDAVNHVGQNPANNSVTICLSPGVYAEEVDILKGQDGITLVGFGAKTVISGSNKKSRAGGSFRAATLHVMGNNFKAINFVVENTFKTVTIPSPAVTVESASTTWDTVSILAWDDTLGVHKGRHLFTKCYISGNTDMIWGFGRAAFVDSQIYVRFFYSKTVYYTGDIATFGTDKSSKGTEAGAVFWNCKITGDRYASACLGRPYRPVQHVAFVNCYMSNVVCPPGWNDYNGNLAKKQFDFREYRSYGPGAKQKSRKYGKFLSADPAAFYRPKFFLGL